MTAGRFVGQSVERREDLRLLTGRGRYIADVRVPGALEAAFLRSQVARGQITHLDVSAARAMPGVHAVLTASELNPLVRESWLNMVGPDVIYPPKYALADGDVRYVGDPIAVVIADDRYVAEDALENIDLEIHTTKAIADIDGALRAGEANDFVHRELGTNTPQVISAVPDPELEALFEGANRTVTTTFKQHRYIQVPMETRGIIADWDPWTQTLDLWAATQSPHDMRMFYSRLLGIPEHRIRVRMPDVGGGFGLKVFSLRDEWAIVLASTVLQHPIRWIEDRGENLVAAAHARDEEMTLSMAVDSDGSFRALRADLRENVGAYPYPGPAANGTLTMFFATGPYRIPKLSFSNTATYTNTCGRAPYRGPFLMQTVGPEQLVDVVAREIGMDPLELRRRNIVRAEDLPYTMASGLPIDDVTFGDTLEQAAKLIGYDEFRTEQAAGRADGRMLGIGISLCMEPSAIAFGNLATEAITLRIDATGKVMCVLSSASTGMSVETTMLQVIADTLGCDMEDITFVQGDTTMTPYGAGTQGSRSAVIHGNTTLKAATELRSKVVDIAAGILEAAEADLELSDGSVWVKGTPSASMSLAEIAALAYLNSDALPAGIEPGLEVTTRWKAPPFTYSNACHMCTVEIDPATGGITILRYVVSEDCGRMINPRVVEGQIAGGVVQGIGGVLLEHMPYDPDGNPLAGTFVDYLLPTTTEVPTIEIGHIESPAPNPLGVKGLGEGGAIASPAAVFNAVADALSPIGVEVRSTPLGPSQILALLRDAGR